MATQAGAVALAIGLFWAGAPNAEFRRFAWWQQLLIVGGALAVGIGAIAITQQNHRAVGLEAENDQLQKLVAPLQAGYSNLIRLEVSSLWNVGLNLGDADRISLYRHNGTAFVMLGRHARNPEYQKRGRTIYPDNQGCIREAWRQGYCDSGLLPDPTRPLTFRSYRSEMRKRWDMPQEVVDGMKMKSRHYIACRLAGADRDNPVAVVVIETTADQGFSEEKIQQIRNHLIGPKGVQLGKFIEIVGSVGPNLGYAEAEGY